ncbi:MAG TPA: tRNA (adenosine(37)-N6)-dimethylallyltransferase MiaA [Deltaproteobacteria bacterium]|nr:tRNA (adenosine(37)-N6)-dimethylallyltransferase MiaA [Deltaproteobacteria bacterium]
MVQEGLVSVLPPWPDLIVVAGATATGKSAFAEGLACERGGEILNADSQQFYRGFDIGTGKPPEAERRVPHWLYDACAPGESMSAMEFVRRAEILIKELRARGKLPVVVGGTGLYLKALLEGFDPLPGRDPELRRRLEIEFQREGGEALRERLRKIDPASAAWIPAGDRSRLIRYLEIGELTGRAPSEQMRRSRPERLRFRTETFWLRKERETLRKKIAARVEAMLQAGWLEEVRNLLAAGVDPRKLENRPIGYSELAEVVLGKRKLEEAAAEIILRTQQYAKRQETFFRAMFAHAAYREQGSELNLIVA